MAYQRTDEAQAATRERHREKGRQARSFFTWWIAASVVIAVAVGVYAPFAELFGNTERWIALAGAAFVLLVLVAMGWLVAFVARRPQSGS